jgi:biotin transport system substrate-specific component
MKDGLMKTYLMRAEVMRSVAARKAVLVLAGIGVLTASAWLSVPFYPVPLTLQTLAVLLIRGTLGPTAGLSAVFGYLMMGALGAPVFHGGLGGAVVLAGPTGGYLLGFVPAVFVMGWVTRAAMGHAGAAAQGGGLRRMMVLSLGAILASAAIYMVGVPWLAVASGLGLERAVAIGLVPFLLGDLLKAAVAVGALYLGGRALSQWRPSFF